MFRLQNIYLWHMKHKHIPIDRIFHHSTEPKMHNNKNIYGVEESREEAAE